MRDDGAVTNGWPVHGTARRGLVLVPEREKVFESLTVQENLAAARAAARAGSRAIDPAQVFAYFPVLAERRRRPAGLLSEGDPP